MAAALDGNNIRAAYAASPDMASMALRAELENVAFAYTGMKADAENPIFDEMLVFVLKSFQHLGMYEIREAFRLAADGTTGTEDSDLRAYFGNWSIASLGAILQAYEKYRKTIIAKFQIIESEAKAAALPAQAKQTTEDYERARIQRLKTDPNILVTVNDYSILCKYEFLKLDKPTWQKYLQRGIEQIKAEMDSIINGDGDGGEKLEARNALAKIQRDKIDDDLWGTIQAEAKRMAVRDWAAEAPF